MTAHPLHLRELFKFAFPHLLHPQLAEPFMDIPVFTAPMVVLAQAPDEPFRIFAPL